MFLREFDLSIFRCVQHCSPYFSATATQEVLDEIRPQLCLVDSTSTYYVMKILERFLPINLPPSLHNQGFKYVHAFSLLFIDHLSLPYARLWLTEFFGIWESLYNDTLWELVSLIYHFVCNLTQFNSASN